MRKYADIGNSWDILDEFFKERCIPEDLYFGDDEDGELIESYIIYPSWLSQFLKTVKVYEI